MNNLLILFIIATIGLQLSFGCASTDYRVSAEKQIVSKSQQKSKKTRIIIKFKDRNINPLQPGFIEGLSRDANAEISYLRSMSGDAHVFLVDIIDLKTSIGDIILQLSKRADVMFVEQDKLMQHR